MAATARLENAPKPPAFLDPLFGLDDCYYYAVPRFFDAAHPATSWLMKRIIAGDVESLRRKLEFAPNSLRNRYFQVLDDPAVYLGDRQAGAPMFHRKCLLYLTPLGMCLYFKSPEALNLLLSFRSPSNEPVSLPEETQFASHLQDTSAGDFHAFVPFIILMKREFFDASVPLQASGWQPGKPMAMPLRRRYERRVMYYRDWLDAALGQLCCRPAYPMANLVVCITANPLYIFSRLPLEAVKPDQSAKNKAQQPKAKGAGSGKRAVEDDPALHLRHGTIAVGDHPLSVPLVGAKKIIDLCEEYERVRQKRQTAVEIRALLREAGAVGLNTEILMMQAEDCIAQDANSTENESNANAMPEVGDFPEGPRRRRLLWRLNSNNHAKTILQPPEEREHCSEPLRILLSSLTKEKSCASQQQCLDAVAVYVKRNYFNCPQALPFEHARNRDMRNVNTCLLNLISREQLAIDKLVARIRAGDGRWRSLESAKQVHTTTIVKVTGLMTSILLSSKEIVNFLAANSFPPYPPSTVDFSVSSHLASIMTSVRYGVVRDLNGCKDAWKYLTKDMLAQAVEDSAILLHFKVGKRPTEAAMAEFRKRLGKQLKSKSKRE